MQPIHPLPVKGMTVECLRGGNDGGGNRLHPHSNYVVTGVFTEDAQADSNGEVAAVTVTVSGDGTNPAAYPFRWDWERFQPIHSAAL